MGNKQSNKIYFIKIYSIKIYTSKIENRITFKIKIGYYLELLTPETMKLLGNTRSKKKKIKMAKMFLM